MEADWKEIEVEWCGDNGFLGKSNNGGIIQIGNIDEQPGPSPMELMLMGVGGCTGIDIVSILKKKRQNLQDLRVEVRGKRAATHPRVYTYIEIVYHFWGENIDESAVQQAIELSEEKYCSASAMLRLSAEFCSKYIIHSPDDEKH